MPITGIRANPTKAMLASRKAASSRLRRMALPDSFLDDLVAEMPAPKPVFNLSEQELKAFLSGGRVSRLVPPWEGDKIGAFEKAIGAEPWYVEIDQSGVGERTAGAYSLCLASLPEDSFCMMGDVARLFDPDKDDYTKDVEDVVCDSSGAGLAMAYAMIGRLALADASSSPESILAMAGDAARTKCQAFLKDPPRPDDVSLILAPDDDLASKARAMLEDLGKAVPVMVSPGRLPAREVRRESAGAIPVVATMRYFSPGDRVSTKLTASLSPRKGVISDATANRIVVEWDDSQERTSMDFIEAMASLMWEPKSEPPAPSVYSLPGMDEETCSALVAAGVDPVDLYSLASHHAPSSGKAGGWQRALIDSLKSLGVSAAMVKGSAFRDGKFTKGSWIEARVGGGRLVIDVAPGRLEIVAGNPWTHVPEPSMIEYQDKIECKGDLRIGSTQIKYGGNPRAPVMFHVAPRADRSSILTRGIDYRQRFQASPRPDDSPDVSWAPRGNYLDENLSSAERYDREYPVPTDIWEVDTRGLKLYPDPAWFGGWYCKARIGPERIRLHGGNPPKEIEQSKQSMTPPV